MRFNFKPKKTGFVKAWVRKKVYLTLKKMDKYISVFIVRIIFVYFTKYCSTSSESSSYEIFRKQYESENRKMHKIQAYEILSYSNHENIFSVMASFYNWIKYELYIIFYRDFNPTVCFLRLFIDYYLRPYDQSLHCNPLLYSQTNTRLTIDVFSSQLYENMNLELILSP